jgi:hypothetical protein
MAAEQVPAVHAPNERIPIEKTPIKEEPAEKAPAVQVPAEKSPDAQAPATIEPEQVPLPEPTPNTVDDDECPVPEAEPLSPDAQSLEYRESNVSGSPPGEEQIARAVAISNLDLFDATPREATELKKRFTIDTIYSTRAQGESLLPYLPSIFEPQVWEYGDEVGQYRSTC